MQVQWDVSQFLETLLYNQPTARLALARAMYGRSIISVMIQLSCSICSGPALAGPGLAQALTLALRSRDKIPMPPT